MTKTLPIHITIAPQVLFRELDGESVLLNLQNEQYYGLNAVGTRVWQLINENKNVSQVVQSLLDKYEVEEEQIRQDLAHLLENLAQVGLITLTYAK